MKLRALAALVCALTISTGLATAIDAQAPVDTAVYVVAYVEVLPDARVTMINALTQYRDASRKDAGMEGFDLLEQNGRRGHFAVVEKWRDQAAFDAHAKMAHVKAFLDALAAIRLSGYDQRPYKTLTTAAPRGTPDTQAIVVVSHVDVGGPPGEAPGLLRQLAETSRGEAGCLRFDVVQHTMRANHFTVVEVWSNQRTQEAHAAAAHTKQYRDKLQPMTGSPLDERLYRSVG
jgi:quinol monooxygenase YgiN